MTKILKTGSNRNPETTPSKAAGQSGFGLVEAMIAMLILLGAFVMIAAAVPLAALMHRTALERETAVALAQAQMEYFLTNPGPIAGYTGTQSDFINAGQFPAGYTGTITARSFAAGGGLTLIIITVTPPHCPRVEISAIDTTFSNI